MRISLFFPTYNEQENIALSVHDADMVLSRLVQDRMLTDYEIIIVDDGSSDDTPEIADELSIKYNKVRVVHHETNLGYGAALWTGIQSANFEWVFFTDADLQFKLEEISRLLPFTKTHRVILGFRSPRKDPYMRLLNAKGWNFLNRLLFNLRVKDIDCAFKLFERDLVADLPLQTRGATMSAEMLIRLENMGIEFKEIPVTHLPRQKGVATGAKLAVIIRAFKELYGLYRGDLGKSESSMLQAGKFGLVGVLNTFLDLATYYLLTRYIAFFGSHILSAKSLSFFLGTISSFVLNRYFTFKMRSKLNLGELARFYSTVAFTLAANVGSLYVFNSILKIHDLVAVVFATLFTFVLGFIFSKLWVFRNTNTNGPTPVRRSFKELRPEKLDWQEIARASNDV